MFIVDVDKNALGIIRPGGTRRPLTHLGKLEFHPAGAPAVRIRFERTPSGMSLSLLDLVVRASRQG